MWIMIKKIMLLLSYLYDAQQVLEIQRKGVLKLQCTDYITQFVIGLSPVNRRR